jgi:hypothetical protein
MRLLLALLPAVILGCAYYSGPKPPPLPADMVPVQAPEAVTWHTSIQVLTKNGLPIEDLWRNAGWIETQVRSVDQTEAAAWADCVDPLQNAIAGPDRLAVLVRLEQDGDARSKIHVETEWSYSQDSEVTCQSRGVWEPGMLAKIKEAAEANAAAAAAVDAENS